VQAAEQGLAEDYTLIPITDGECVEIETGFFQSTKDCIELTPDAANFTYNSSDKRYITTSSPSTGDFFADDYFTMKLRNISTGEYTLEGTNFSNANGIFLVVYEDGGSGKKFFQKSGTVNIKSYNSSNNRITAEFKDVVLEEVTISGSTNASSKVPYGSCRKIKNMTLSY
jgi:hypothetical protein